MAEIDNQNELPEDVSEEDTDVVILTDEDGKDEKFRILASLELDGKTYYALTSAEKETDEYVILRLEGEDENDFSLVTVDDDEEFDRVADEFEDKFFNEIDYDEDGEN